MPHPAAKSFSTFAQAIGIGLALTGMQDQFSEDSPSTTQNISIASTGFVFFAIGALIEFCFYSRSMQQPKFDSTYAICKALDLSAGIGVVNSITHFSKGIDKRTANLGNLGTGLFLKSVSDEVSSAIVNPISSLKWEKLRFLTLLSGDLLIAEGLKPLINSGQPDLKSMLLLGLGIGMSIAEWVYGRKNDIGLNLSSALILRSSKLTSALNLFFTIQDLVKQNFDKYTIADDGYAVLSTGILLAAIVKMSWERKNSLTTPLLAGIITAKAPNTEILSESKEDFLTLNHQAVEAYRAGNYSDLAPTSRTPH